MSYESTTQSSVHNGTQISWVNIALNKATDMSAHPLSCIHPVKHVEQAQVETIANISSEPIFWQTAQMR